MPSRILVVEDNPVNRRVAQHMLERLGCDVGLAENGLDALHLARVNPYDLIFMDCLMPEMDGYEATRQLRVIQADTGRIPIIALTAHDAGHERERCMQAGMDDFITKPVSIASFSATLKVWLGASA